MPDRPSTSDAQAGQVASPLARYAPYRRAGDLVYFAGIVAADPATQQVVSSYSDLPENAPQRGRGDRRDVG